MKNKNYEKKIMDVLAAEWLTHTYQPVPVEA